MRKNTVFIEVKKVVSIFFGRWYQFRPVLKVENKAAGLTPLNTSEIIPIRLADRDSGFAGFHLPAIDLVAVFFVLSNYLTLSVPNML